MPFPCHNLPEMSLNTLGTLFFVFLTTALWCDAKAQNRNFLLQISLGVGNSGFQIEDVGEDEVKRIYYPVGGIHLQKRISPSWALDAFPNVDMSGNRRILETPIGQITEIRSTSAFLNLSLHPKYIPGRSFYVSLGPEISYLLWNYGSTYQGDERLSNIRETDFFNRTNLLISSSVGFSQKVGESRKNAPVQIDVFWHLEFRAKKGITNILNRDVFGNNASSTILSFELVTGISFASKR